MTAEFFLDTNVLIYAFTEQDARKKVRSRELHELALSGRGIVSFQVPKAGKVRRRRLAGRLS
jgi:predicted nucleic acid-binding protein